MSVAIEKFSQEVAAERTVSTVSLPNDELKEELLVEKEEILELLNN